MADKVLKLVIAIVWCHKMSLTHISQFPTCLKNSMQKAQCGNFRIWLKIKIGESRVSKALCSRIFQNGKIRSKNKFLNFCTNDGPNQSWDFSPFENSIEMEKFWYFCNNFFGSKLAKVSKIAKCSIFPLVTKIFDRKMILYVSSPVELKFNFPS